MKAQEIEATKVYTLQEASKILGYSADHKNQWIRYLLGKWFFNGFVEVVGGTPKFPRRAILGQGLINYLNDRAGK